MKSRTFNLASLLRTETYEKREVVAAYFLDSVDIVPELKSIKIIRGNENFSLRGVEVPKLKPDTVLVVIKEGKKKKPHLEVWGFRNQKLDTDESGIELKDMQEVALSSGKIFFAERVKKLNGDEFIKTEDASDRAREFFRETFASIEGSRKRIEG